MRRIARKILIVLLVVLPVYLSWVTTTAVPAYRIDQYDPSSINIPANMEDTGSNPVTLILLGTGLLNLAIWGRNQCRKGQTDPGGTG